MSLPANNASSVTIIFDVSIVDVNGVSVAATNGVKIAGIYGGIAGINGGIPGGNGGWPAVSQAREEADQCGHVHSLHTV